MGKDYNASTLSAWTTGAGIAVGTNVDVCGVWAGTAATTVTLKHGAAGTASFIVMSAAAPGAYISLGPVPIASSGPLNGTSSGGSFAVAYRQRPQ
jgi:hypothetical protein